MSRGRAKAPTSAPTPLSTQLGLATVAAATTWAALLAWRGFLVRPADYLGPLLVLGVLVGGVGALGRWWRLPAAAVVAGQVVLSGLVACTMLCGAPLPVGDARTRLVSTFRDALASANRYAPPVPLHVPSVAPLLIAGGLACFLLVDILALTLRRVPLAGLPLLVIYSVPISMIGTDLSWWVFALTAVGFLALLYLHESDSLSRWGRQLSRPGSLTPVATDADPQAFGTRTGAVRSTAAVIGSTVTVLALAVPLAVPTLSLHVFDFGVGNGGGDQIHLSNPMVSLQRDLVRGEDVPLLTVHTDDPDPSYLRIAVLDDFDGEHWSAGDRNVPATNRADGMMPALLGVASSVTRHDYSYRISADSAFDSTWLPTTQNVSRIETTGDWRYDVDDMDFAASGDRLTTAGQTWDFTGVKLALKADQVNTAGSSNGQVGSQFTALPSNLDASVRDLALAVTRNATTPFAKAVALQQWFRSDGGFVYDDTVHLGDGPDDLKAFLTQGGDGRRGYCQQFAAAMAAMARTLDIPARVAVGFLTPDKINADTYVYSAHDMHAWPELYFAGAGWVRFEPTPASRAASVPNYTTQALDVPDVTLPSAGASAASDVPDRTDQTDKARDRADAAQADRSGSDTGRPWGRIAAGGGLLVLLLAGLASPRFVRRRRRDRRRSGGAEAAWAELRDTAVDLGVPWPRQRSPRETRDVLVRYFGAPIDGAGAAPERPARGAQLSPDAVRALDRVVLSLERLRYARVDVGGSDGWRAEVDTCVDALFAGAPRARRRAATWWPASVFSRSAPIEVQPLGQAAVPIHSGAVDHVS